MSNEFHTHLDQCYQCRTNPFSLCAEGHRLIMTSHASEEDAIFPQAPRESHTISLLTPCLSATETPK